MSEPSAETKTFDEGLKKQIYSGSRNAEIERRTALLPPDEEEEKKLLRTIKIHVASENYTVMEDGVLTSPNGTDLNIVNKKSGVGFIIRNNGDIMIQSGGGEGGADETDNGSPGTANTGGGGGGGTSYDGVGQSGGGNGGSGIVIIRFPSTFTIQFETSGLTYSSSTSGTDTVIQFTAGTGTISFNE